MAQFTVIMISALSVGLLALSCLILYLFSLAVTYFLRKKGPPSGSAECSGRFVFVVPAHDEEAGIAATVASLLAVRYPRSLFDVVVVADNCSDATAAVARESGALCLERRDPILRGKGYALRHAFDLLLPLGYDVFVIVDADSKVSANFLSGLCTRLSQGAQVVQAYYGVANPEASVMTYLFQVGNLIENRLFWEPKQGLGLPVLLRGNGMCFNREVLDQYPWEAFSITEDTEYGMKLISEGVRIDFASEIGVFAHQPETLQQAFVQRVRWSAGNCTLTRARALRLIAEGFSRGNLYTFDLGVSLIVASRPLMLAANLLLALCCAMISAHLHMVWALLLLLAQFLYLGIGVILNGLSARKLLRLLQSPFYLTWLCVVSLLGAAGFRKNEWARTTRS